MRVSLLGVIYKVILVTLGLELLRKRELCHLDVLLGVFLLKPHQVFQPPSTILHMEAQRPSCLSLSI